MKNKAVKIAGAASLGFGVFMVLGWSLFDGIIRCRKRKKPSKSRRFELQKLRINHPRCQYGDVYETGKTWCREQVMEERTVVSHDGLRLYGSFLPAKDTQRLVLLCHGYRGSGFGDFANTARFLHENGCGLLFIDQRCCGKSEGKYITFGGLEREDIVRWAWSLSKENREYLPIYLYGESMGASSVLMASGLTLPPETRGLIADCGFRSMRGQVREMAANWFHLRHVGLLLFRLDLLCRLFARFRMRDADTSNALRKNTLPVLFFHGAEDTYVDPENSRLNYAICRAPKELVLVPKARHLCSPYADPTLYRKKLLDFFAKYDKNVSPPE